MAKSREIYSQFNCKSTILKFDTVTAIWILDGRWGRRENGAGNAMLLHKFLCEQTVVNASHNDTVIIQENTLIADERSN